MFVQFDTTHIDGAPLSTTTLAMQVPLRLHALPEAEQSTQAKPPRPHVAVDWPPWQMPLESQQPLH